MVTVLKKCINKYLGGVRRRDSELGLLNPLHVFDPSPNIFHTSRHLCLFYIDLNLTPLTRYFHKFRYLQLKPYRHGVNQAKKMTSIYANEPLRKSVRTWTVLGFVKFWERGITRQWFYVINFTSLQSWKKMLSNVFVNNLKFLNEEGKMHLIDYGKRTEIFFDNITFNYSITEV